MPVSDRLDEIEADTQACMKDRPTDPNAVELAMKVPSLVTALRAVLELHVLQFDRTVDQDGEPGSYCDACNVGPWPCPTVRVVEAELGGES